MTIYRRQDLVPVRTDTDDVTTKALEVGRKDELHSSAVDGRETTSGSQHITITSHPVRTDVDDVTTEAPEVGGEDDLRSSEVDGRFCKPMNMTIYRRQDLVQGRN